MRLFFYEIMKYPLPINKEYFYSISNVFEIVKKIGFYKKQEISLNEKILSYKDEKLILYVQEINKWGFLYKSFPFVSQIRVVGSVSFGAIKEGSDIDLLIICKKNRLWLCRFFTVLFGLLTKSAWFKKKKEKKFDFNFYLEEDSLNIYSVALKPVDWYLIYWIAHAVLIYKENDENFIEHNSWIKAFLPYHPLRPVINLGTNLYTGNTFIKIFFEKIFSGKIGDFFNELIKKIRLPIMISKRKKFGDRAWGVILGDKILKFHSEDIRKKVNTLAKIYLSKKYKTGN